MSSDLSSQPRFDEMKLSKSVLKAIYKAGYEVPTSIQQLTIPLMLKKNDIIAQAQTGTGKTAAFACPLLSLINSRKKIPQVLVLTPTRELAIQVAESFKKYASQIKGFRVLPVYGGQGYEGQLKSLKRGVHVIVGTPGRLIDHIKKGTLQFKELSCVVLDEADEMLHMGFIEDIEWILNQIPSEHQTALFSATMPDAIKKIARKHLNNPQELIVKQTTATADTIHQRFLTVKPTHKLDALTRILESVVFDCILIFVRTKTATVELAEKIEARGFAAEALNGDIAQKNRERIVNRLKQGKIDILIATDVAARGLDIERVTHVVNYDIPNNAEAYIHRIGRTGRAGKKGEAILFASPREKWMIRVIEKSIKKKMTQMVLPSNETINDTRITRFNQKITDTLLKNNLKPYRDLLEKYRKENNVPALDIAAALAKISQGEKPFLLNETQKKKSEKRNKIQKKNTKNKRKSLKTDMDKFRIEVGNSHGAGPRDIVGAISGETGLDSVHIGNIDINDTFTIVELPKGMPDNIYKLLKKVWLCQRQFKITKIN